MRPKPDFLPRMRGATGSVAGRRGLVPKPAAADNVKFLKGDGSWSALANASAATDAEAAAGASTTTFLTPAGATLSAGHAGRAARPGIISTGASAVGTTQDNTGLAFGTGNLTIGAWVRLADWTPGVVKYLMAKNMGATALSFYIDGSNRLAIEIGASAYHSTATLTVTDGAWAYLTATIERSGNATWYINGAAFGTAANISGSAATTLTGTGALAWFSSSAGGSLTAGTIGETFIVSGLLTATNIADIYRAGSIAPFAASFTFFQWPDFGLDTGMQVVDRSGNATPQIVLRGTSGITHTHPSRRVLITPGTLTFGGAGTQQICGASVVDTARKYRVAFVAGTSNASVNLSLGNTGSGTQYISAQAVTAADFDIGTFASRVISGANLYLTLSGAGIITNLAIELQQVD